MRVRMTEDRTAALDGINATTLTAGEVYDLPQALAGRYIELSAAEADEPEPPAGDAKAADPDLESRAAAPPPENKPAAKRGARSRK